MSKSSNEKRRPPLIPLDRNEIAVLVELSRPARENSVEVEFNAIDRIVNKRKRE